MSAAATTATTGFTRQQQAAIECGGNVLVVAGAGTGKTRTLVARVLRLVAEERVSLESLLMVTFTEAAAAEMRARLRHELHALQAARPNDEHRAGQLALLDVARICTLHSFCLQLAREHFHELGLDPQFGVLDESQTRPLMRATLDELLERHYGGDAAQHNSVRALVRAMGRGGDDKVRGLILKLHEYSQSLPDPARWLNEQERRLAQVEPAEWRRFFLEAVIAWRREWEAELAARESGAPAVGLCLAALRQIPISPSAAEACCALKAVVETDRDAANWPRGTKSKVRALLGEFFAAAAFLFELSPDDAGVAPLAQDWEWSRHHLTALVSLTREFTEEFARAKRDLGGVDFADLEQCALRLLREPAGGGPTATARAWRERLEHVFVDEYQDINDAQDAILSALSREGDDANRFLVGDVKQSIYRFRRANPKIFQRYKAAWEPKPATADPAPASEGQTSDQSDGPAASSGTALSLTENFRSREGLLRFINPLFSALMRAEAGGVNYEALEFGMPAQRAALAAKPGGATNVEFHLITRARQDTGPEETEGEDGKAVELADLPAIEREARLVAGRLLALRRERFQVWDAEQKAFRDVRWSDVAVLLRSPAGRAEAFAKEFSLAGVPVIAARAGFFASLEVSDLLSLLKLLDNPLQDVPLLAVLRSPLVGMSLEDLVEIRAAARNELFWTALVRLPGIQTPESKAQSPGRAALMGKVESFLAQFNRWRDLIRQTSLSQCLETALSETHYEALLLAGERGVERAASVRRLLDLARQFDPYQRQGLYRFLRFVEAQEDDDLDLPTGATPNTDAVRLLSIHKSKGLEFPVVVLAGLGTRFNEQDLNSSVLVHERFGLCPRISPPEMLQGYSGLTHWLARKSERRELRAEELRLFYVALTRARDALLLVGTTGCNVSAASWQSEQSPPLNATTIVNARSQLDWLLHWLPRATKSADWHDDRSGGNDLLRWKVHPADDPAFTAAGAAVKPGNSTAIPHSDESAAIEAIKTRIAWQYPFVAATKEAAKTSVSALRRRMADEPDGESKQWFVTRVERPAARRDSQRSAARLSAAERGTAHHLFLQHVELQRAGDEAGLRKEASRLKSADLLTVDQVAALDFASLAEFWTSQVGQKIRDEAEHVRREVPFTARFTPREVEGIVGAQVGRNLEDEFVVVQGVADLVVFLPGGLWLLDFKTDDVGVADLAAKVDHYQPQLKLYALALARIHRRPVTECWLHFLACGKTEKLAEAAGAMASNPAH